LIIGFVECKFHINNLLSFPPEANYCVSGDHFNPHTSYLWPSKVRILISGHLRSLINIVLSLDPEHRSLLFHAIAPTRPVWPGKVLKHFSLFVSHI